MTEEKSPSGLFYGWVVVLAGTLVMSAVMGVVFNCASQFIKPVCADLGFSRQAMSAIQTIIAVIQMIISLSWGKILPKIKLKNMMVLWAIIGPIAYFCNSFATQIWQFYAIAVLLALTMSMLTVLPFSYILTNWFYEKKGLAMGICFMGSGLGGMILNPFLGQWLTLYGWRMSYRILGVIMLVVALPCVLFFVKMNPAQMGLKPLGHESMQAQTAGAPVEADGMMLSEARKTLRFWLLCVCCMCINMGLSSMVMSLSPHLTDNGYTLTFASAMVSVSMGAMAVGKIALGQIFDKLGTKRASLFSMASGFCGLMGMIFCRTKPMLALIILGIGFGCSYGTVGGPVMAQNVFGRKDYSAILGIFTACNGLGGAIAPIINGAVFDSRGSYTPAFYLWAALIAGVFVCFGFVLPSYKSEKAKNIT